MEIVNNKTDQNLAMILHLSGFLNGMFPIVIPLIIWLVKKDESSFINTHGKSALNFQLSVIIIGFLAYLFILFTFGLGALFVIPLAALFCITYVVCIIQAAIKAHKGLYYNYPFSWQIIK